MKYDYLLVGSGLFNAVFAHEAKKHGKTCLVIEARDHIGGNIYTKEIEGIQVHLYGAHIFRTSNLSIWRYMEQFTEFNRFVNSPIANYRGKIFNLPFNMNTFAQMWGVVTPAQAKAKIEEQQESLSSEPRNLEEHVISLVGRDIYQTLVKEYTEKQWGKLCTELPASVMRRIPVRFTYDNNYYRDPYQGIPIGGYTRIIERMFEGCEVIYGADYNADKEGFRKMAKEVVYTGTIDSYFDYQYGALEYRSLRFEHEILDEENHQGVAVMNFTGHEAPYTRQIEHKHFEFGTQPKTVISREYSFEWSKGHEPYYPINDRTNDSHYAEYAAIATQETGVHFCGRLGTYQYTDMQDTVSNALAFAREQFS